MIWHDEQLELTEEDKRYIDSLPPVNVWWDKMQARIKKSNKRWAKKKEAERAKGIYK
ncbi:MAG: hypothetical protein IMY67_11185 [Bacteroidetes bacterium]|nr:hypothetical protein [Bacteroidota bacterium]